MPTLSQILNTAPLTFSTGLNKISNTVSLNANLDDLIDTITTTPTVNQILSYDGNYWINKDPTPPFILNTDLTAISNITSSGGLLKKLNTGFWTLDINQYLYNITVTGDVTGISVLSTDTTMAGHANITLTLANSGVVANTYNTSSTNINPFTVDAKGRVTNVGTAITITPDWIDITNNPLILTNPILDQVICYNGSNWINKALPIINWSNIGNNPITITNPIINQVLVYDGISWINSTPSPTFSLDADLTAIGDLTGTNGLLRKMSTNTWTLDTNNYLTNVNLIGDITGTNIGGSITTTLAISGVTAGTYNNNANYVNPFTVDAKGRVTNVGTAITITPDWANIVNNPIVVTNPVLNQILSYDGMYWINTTPTSSSTGNTTAYEIICTDWSAGNFTLPIGWIATKVNSDTALQITHNQHKPPISWSGINTLALPNLAIVPSSTRNMQIDSTDQSTFLQVGSLGSFKLYLLFL